MGFAGGRRRTRTLCSPNRASDRLDALDPRNFLAKDPLDAASKRHLGHGAAVAGTGEPDLDDALGGDVHQFHIPAVGLKRGRTLSRAA